MTKKQWDDGMRAFDAGFPPPEDLLPVFTEMLLCIKSGEDIDLLGEDGNVIGKLYLVDNDICEVPVCLY